MSQIDWGTWGQLSREEIAKRVKTNPEDPMLDEFMIFLKRMAEGNTYEEIFAEHSAWIIALEEIRVSQARAMIKTRE